MIVEDDWQGLNSFARFFAKTQIEKYAVVREEDRQRSWNGTSE